MKIALIHNYYRLSGGEDQVFADEAALLESHGHQVVRLSVHNNSTARMGHLTLAGKTIWNHSAAADLHRWVQTHRPDIVHFHNTFPLLSPAVYSAASAAGAAVVQTLHNYRLICPNALLFRDGHVCEDCLHKMIPWPAAVHRCYRGSSAASAAVAAMIALHRAGGTYLNDVDAYVSLTQFARDKFIAAGFPAQRLWVKPNFIFSDPGPGRGGAGALFVGRLEREKGVLTLLETWQKLATPIELKIVGDGALAESVRQAAGRDRRIQWLGKRPGPEVAALMGAADALIFPSLWYEGMPKTILESLSRATPVIASRLGSMIEMIADGKTGAHFTAGDSDDLAGTVTRIFADTSGLAKMRHAARLEFGAKYMADRNYDLLMQIYAAARQSNKRRAA